MKTYKILHHERLNSFNGNPRYSFILQDPRNKQTISCKTKVGDIWTYGVFKDDTKRILQNLELNNITKQEAIELMCNSPDKHCNFLTCDLTYNNVGSCFIDKIDY